MYSASENNAKEENRYWLEMGKAYMSVWRGGGCSYFMKKYLGELINEVVLPWICNIISLWQPGKHMKELLKCVIKISDGRGGWAKSSPATCPYKALLEVTHPQPSMYTLSLATSAALSSCHSGNTCSTALKIVSAWLTGKTDLWFT